MNSKATIAVVDDNDLIRTTLELILTKHGFIVLAFSCATELLNSTALRDADCVLTDLEMPKMDGCELQAYLALIRPDLPVVFMTGNDDEQRRSSALRDGAFAYLRKPTPCAHLLAVLEDAAAGYGVRRGHLPRSYLVV